MGDVYISGMSVEPGGRQCGLVMVTSQSVWYPRLFPSFCFPQLCGKKTTRFQGSTSILGSGMEKEGWEETGY